MKKVLAVLFSLSLVVLFAASKDVSVQKSTTVAASYEKTDFPIWPPV